MIDSEPVPCGKGEKQPGEGDEIVSETMCLQWARAVRAQAFMVIVFLLKNEPASVYVSLLNLEKSGEGVGKPSLNRALIVVLTRPETEWAIHGQVESRR